MRIATNAVQWEGMENACEADPLCETLAEELGCLDGDETDLLVVVGSNESPTKVVLFDLEDLDAEAEKTYQRLRETPQVRAWYLTEDEVAATVTLAAPHPQ